MDIHGESTDQVPICMQDLWSRPNGGKIQTAFFRYWFMNLIFIYFSKRRGGGYWRRTLVRGTLVDVKCCVCLPCKQPQWFCTEHQLMVHSGTHDTHTGPAPCEQWTHITWNNTQTHNISTTMIAIINLLLEIFYTNELMLEKMKQ